MSCQGEWNRRETSWRWDLYLHFTDEANFYLSGLVNSQNRRIWGLENPHATVTKVKSKEKVMVWCAITSDGIIGPYFYGNGNVNGESYLEMLRIYHILHRTVEEKKDRSLKNIYFQQDGATVHCTEDVLQYSVLGTKLASSQGNVSSAGPLIHQI